MENYLEWSRFFAKRDISSNGCPGEGASTLGYRPRDDETIIKIKKSHRGATRFCGTNR